MGNIHPSSGPGRWDPLYAISYADSNATINANASWCAVDSVYLSFMSPNTAGTPTMPLLVSPDPNKLLFRALTPSVILLVYTFILIMGRKFWITTLSILGAGIGAAIACGAVFGRPTQLPKDTSCNIKLLSTIFGGAAGIVLMFIISKCFPSVLYIIIGGVFVFGIFQQYPQLDLIVTGFPQLDRFKLLFLGWGYVFWTVFAVVCIVSFVILYCFSWIKSLKKYFLISIMGGWTLNQSIRLIARSNTYQDKIPLPASIVMFIVFSILLFPLQILIDNKFFKKKEPLETRSNTVRRVFR